MKKVLLHIGLASIALGALGLGCDRGSPSTPAPTAPPPQPTANMPTTPAPNDMSNAAGNAMKGANDMAGSAAVNTPAMPAAPTPGAAMPAAPKPAETQSASTAQAQSLFEQAMTYVKEHKLDLADQSLQKLDAMKDQLPADWAGKIETLRSAIAGAKMSGALQMPK